MDRLKLIYKALASNPYITSYMQMSYNDEGTFDCRASELQPGFLFDTLVNVYLHQHRVPDKATQLVSQSMNVGT